MVNARFIQSATGMRLHVVQNLFRSLVCTNYDVDMAGSDVGRQQCPTSLDANLPNCLQDSISALPIQFIGGFLHSYPQSRYPVGSRRKEGRAEDIVVPIYRTVLVSV